MKKQVLIIFIFIVAFTLIGCGQTEVSDDRIESDLIEKFGDLEKAEILKKGYNEDGTYYEASIYIEKQVDFTLKDSVIDFEYLELEDGWKLQNTYQSSINYTLNKFISDQSELGSAIVEKYLSSWDSHDKIRLGDNENFLVPSSSYSDIVIEEQIEGSLKENREVFKSKIFYENDLFVGEVTAHITAIFDSEYENEWAIEDLKVVKSNYKTKVISAEKYKSILENNLNDSRDSTYKYINIESPESMGLFFSRDFIEFKNPSFKDIEIIETDVISPYEAVVKSNLTVFGPNMVFNDIFETKLKYADNGFIIDHLYYKNAENLQPQLNESLLKDYSIKSERFFIDNQGFNPEESIKRMEVSIKDMHSEAQTYSGELLVTLINNSTKIEREELIKTDLVPTINIDSSRNLFSLNIMNVEAKKYLDELYILSDTAYNKPSWSFYDLEVK